MSVFRVFVKDSKLETMVKFYVEKIIFYYFKRLNIQFLG